MAGQPAPKKMGPRRSRGDSQATLAHGSSKTTVQSTAPESSSSSAWSIEAFKSYLQGVKLEMGRVTWPTGRELQAATVVVMVSLILFAGYLGALDFILQRFFQ